MPNAELSNWVSGGPLLGSYNGFSQCTKNIIKGILIGLIVISVIVMIVVICKKDEFQDVYDDPTGAAVIRTPTNTAQGSYYQARTLADRENRPREAYTAARVAAERLDAGGINDIGLGEQINDMLFDLRGFEDRPINIIGPTTALINADGNGGQGRVRIQGDIAFEFPNIAEGLVDINIWDRLFDTDTQRAIEESTRATPQARWRVDNHNVHDSLMNKNVDTRIDLLPASNKSIESFEVFLSEYMRDGSKTPGPTPKKVNDVYKLMKLHNRGTVNKPIGTNEVMTNIKRSQKELKALMGVWELADTLDKKEALAFNIVDCVTDGGNSVCGSGRLARITGSTQGFDNAPKLMTKATARNAVYAKCGVISRDGKATSALINAAVDEYAEFMPVEMVERVREECLAAADIS